MFVKCHFQIVFKTHALLRLSDVLADSLIGSHNSTDEENFDIELFKAIVDPVTDKIVKVRFIQTFLHFAELLCILLLLVVFSACSGICTYVLSSKCQF